ncbi:MAG: hypothetical protein AAFU61_00210 [Pseudomonadota bacterium]
MTAIDPPLSRAGTAPAPAPAAAAPIGAARRGGGRRVRAADTGEAKGMPTLVAVYLASLTVPLFINVGPVLLQPYRIVLLAAFFPLVAKAFSKDLRLRPFDYLMLAHVGWVVLSILAVHGVSRVEAAGIHVLEVVGAWMLGRAGIRNVAEFRRMVLIYFGLVMMMLPLAIFEGVTRRNLILQYLPSSPRIVYTEPRFGFRRAQVMFSHPIIYGVFVSSSLGLVWFCFETPGKFMVQSMRAGLVALATFFSLSAGALLAYIVQAGLIAYEVMFQKEVNRWRIFFWAVIIGYVTVDLLSNRTPFHILVQYGTFNSASAYNRILIFRYGMDNVWRSPIIGIGFRDWARPFWMGDSVDNFWLLAAMRHGIPAFVFLAGAKILLMREVAKTMLTDPQERAARLGWMVSMGGIIIAGGTVHYWTAMLTMVTFLFASGAWMVRPEAFLDGAQRRRGDGGGRNGPRPGPGTGGRERHAAGGRERHAAGGRERHAAGGRESRPAPGAGGGRRAAPGTGARRGAPEIGNGRGAAETGNGRGAPGTENRRGAPGTENRRGAPGAGNARGPQGRRGASVETPRPLETGLETDLETGPGTPSAAPPPPAPREGPVRPGRPVRGVFDPTAPRPAPAPPQGGAAPAPGSTPPGSTPPGSTPPGSTPPARPSSTRPSSTPPSPSLPQAPQGGGGQGPVRPPRPRGPAR